MWSRWRAEMAASTAASANMSAAVLCEYSLRHEH
jgi:hypothetical protein